MPSILDYKRFMNVPKTIGQAHKIESDKIMLATWNNDIDSKVAYFYDFYHDSEITKFRKLNSNLDKNKTAIDIKFIKNSNQTFNSDTKTFHIQLKPNFDYIDTSLNYYKEYFEDRYNSIFPVGLWCDIPDEKGFYNKWLVVDIADYYDNQFPTFEVLPCNYLLQYIYDNKKYQISTILRSQSSYNSSGEKNKNILTLVDDELSFILPINRETEKLYYGQRFLIDAGVLTEPREWHINKIDRVKPLGVVKATLSQGAFNEHTDYIELDENENVIGMWANYYSNNLDNKDFSPIYENKINNYSVISYSGLKPEIKIGGSYKKFTVNYYNSDGTDSQFQDGIWSFKIDNEDVSDLIEISTTSLNDNQIKIKFIGDNTYLGKILNILYINNEQTISSNLEVEITSL